MVIVSESGDTIDVFSDGVEKANDFLPFATSHAEEYGWNEIGIESAKHVHKFCEGKSNSGFFITFGKADILKILLLIFMITCVDCYTHL